MSLDFLRLLITDVSPDENGEYMFSDEQLEEYLKNTRNVYFAAAYALRTIAADQVLILKYVRTDDLQVDGSVVSKELRLLALDYENQGLREDNVSGDNYGVMLVTPKPRFEVTDRIEGVLRPCR